MSDGDGTPVKEQTDLSGGMTAADLFTAARIPLAIAFPLIEETGWRAVILGTAAATDFIDGWLARRLGPSRVGAFLDPVADKLFMATAFAVVLLAGRLSLVEVILVMLRDLVATMAFLATVFLRQPSSIPARMAGKVVTVAQLLTLVAFLADSPLLEPLAWVTGALGAYAIWDYMRVAGEARRRLGSHGAPNTPSVTGDES